MYFKLLKLAEELNGGPVDDDIKEILLIAAENPTGNAFETFPEDAARKIFGNEVYESLCEAYDSVMGAAIPAQLYMAGAAYGSEVTHDFTADNACPYFQKNELCGLDGRICNYDTETFPVCPRYKEGFTRGIVGLDGKKPEVPPANELPRNPENDQLPFNNPLKTGGTT